VRTRSTLGFGIAVLLALPGCGRILGLSGLQRPCDKRSCAGLCGQIEDGCGGWQDCGSCIGDAGSSDGDAGSSDAGTPSCGDRIQNGSETSVDCGGLDCPACGAGMGCQSPGDCTSGLCTSNRCEPAATCSNQEIDGMETDRDCGGPACGGCPTGMVCRVHADCLSQTCLFGVCRDPTCSDKVRNQDETDVDCGGSCVNKCPNGQHCTGEGDCASGLCSSGACAPSCGVQNGGCDPNATCSQESGRVVCACNGGYVGDGKTCRPTCRRSKVMLVVERSSSMMQSFNNPRESCADVNGNYLASSPNDCKWKDLREALTGASGLLATTRDSALYGLSVFPGANQPRQCGAGDKLISISDSQDNVDAIASALDSLAPFGLRPATSALEELADDAQLSASSADQKRLVLLVIGGVPNCNPANQDTCESCKDQGCGGDGVSEICSSCLASPCSATFPVFPSTLCDTQNPCLDGGNLVAAVRMLAQLGARTFVIGIGAEASSGEAVVALNKAAVAGGLARDASSGSRFYQASTKAELEQALRTFASAHVLSCSQ
jgi:hypothetical protein